MGTFHGTCYLSRLPILTGDDVVFIPLIQSFDETTFNACYPTDNFVPFGMCIRGKYNNYGGIEDPNTLPANIAFFQQFEYFSLVCEDMGCDDDNLVPIIKSQDFCNFVNEILCSHKKIFVRTKCDDKVVNRQLSWMMVHADLYASIVSEVGNRSVLGINASYFELLRTRYCGILAMYRDGLNRCGGASDCQDENLQQLYINLKDDILKCVSFDIVGDMMFGVIYDHWQYWADLLLRDHSDVFDCIVERTTFTYALGLMRNGYHCVSGAGSSENEMFLHTIVAKFVLSRAALHGSPQVPVFVNL